MDLLAITTVDLGFRRFQFAEMLKSLPPDVLLVVVFRGFERPDESIKRLLPDRTECLYVGSASLSKARNLALDHVRSLELPSQTVVGFPDDDCTWDAALPLILNSSFSVGGLKLLLGRYRPADGDFDEDRYPDSSCNLTARIILDRCASIVMFTTLATALECGFDEDLGVGCRWAAGEDTDFALRVLSRAGHGLYEPRAICFHRYEATPDPERRRAGGYVIAKNVWTFPKMVVPLTRFLGRRLLFGPDRLASIWAVMAGLATSVRLSRGQRA